MGKWTILRQRLHEAWLYHFGYLRMPARQRRYTERLQRRGGPVRVVFFALNVPMWKYQGLYDLLSADARFETTVVLSPGITYKPEQRLRDLRHMREYFGSRGIGFVDWRLEADEPPVDVRRRLNPDIVFYTQPYHGSYHPLHCFLNFTDRLIAYSPYSFLQAHDPYNYDNVMQNIAWKCYYANHYHIDESRCLAHNKGRNAVAVGYTSADDYLRGDYTEVWNDPGHQRKRLIWAPHSTVENYGTAFSRSNFLMMADYMVELARRHTADLQIAFKPHPGLLTVLYRHPDWGKEKADAYYDLWRQMPNTQLADGTFTDLFKGSDAMVHDSGSFVVDYLYFNRPVMFITQNIEKTKSYVNEPGQKAYDAHYIGSTNDDVERFVDQVVLQGNDVMDDARRNYYDKYLAQPSGQSTARNMYEDMLRSLNM